MYKDYLGDDEKIKLLLVELEKERAKLSSEIAMLKEVLRKRKKETKISK